VEFVFDGPTDPGRDGTVFGFGALADLFESLRRESDRHHRGQSGSPACGSLWLLVLGVVAGKDSDTVPV
jgi:hypothetical protein